MFCKHCGKPLRGRSDKRFCNDDCRSSYHNQKKRKQRLLRKNAPEENPTADIPAFQEQKEMYSRLINNRRLLKEQLQKGIFFLPLEKLESMGFDASLYTHAFTGSRGEEIRCCYDQAYWIDQQGDVVFLPPLKFMMRLLPSETFIH